MDDILTGVLEYEWIVELNQINRLHPYLKFTLEWIEKDDENETEVGWINFLGMELIIENSWFTKLSNTGIIINWYAIVPLGYKTNLVTGFVNRILSATISYKVFMRGCETSNVILAKYVCPTNWIE